jgi:hypothetical protein
VGRHRNDPRGAGQILAIVAAVILVVALVVLGGFFLWQSLPGTGSASLDQGPVSNNDEATPQEGVLHVRGIGGSTHVLVRETGGQVLTDTVLGEGQYVSFDAPSMDVRIEDPAAVEVHTNGELMDLSSQDGEAAFTVEER